MKKFRFAILSRLGVFLGLAVMVLVQREHLESSEQLELRNDTSSTLQCGNQECFSPILRLGDEQSGTNKPEVLLISGIHGNERTGPVILVNFLKTMCQLYNTNGLITHLMKNLMITVVPMANSWGFYYRKRVASLSYRQMEKNIDPNRDFPYMTHDQSCLQSKTARLIYRIFEEYPIQLAMTFHSGGRSITYPWGDFSHLVRPTNSLLSEPAFKSAEAPDFTLFNRIAKLLQSSAGLAAVPRDVDKLPEDEFTTSTKFTYITPVNHYEIGTSIEVLYPVNGSFEDWAYGYGWSENSSPQVCNVEKFGMTNNMSMVNRAATFLFEVWEHPDETLITLGDERQIFQPSMIDGEVSRSIRMILKGLEMMSPTLKVITPLSRKTVNNTFVLSGALLPIGCETVTYLQVIIILDNGSTLDKMLFSEPRKCQPVNVWEDKNPLFTNATWPNDMKEFKDTKIIFDIRLVDSFPTNIYFVTSFDKNWKQQRSPNPVFPPQTLLIESRSKPQIYTLINKNRKDSTRINGYVVIFCDAVESALRINVGIINWCA